MKTKNTKDFIHTGDVQAVESQLPRNAKQVSKKPVAYGEKSGHLHVITGDYEMFEDEEQNIFVKVGKGGAYSQHVHESIFKNANYDTQEILQKADHRPARLLPEKTYKVGIHQAYDPYKKIKERVID